MTIKIPGDIVKKLQPPGIAKDAPAPLDHADADVFHKFLSEGLRPTGDSASLNAPSAIHGSGQPTMGDRILGGLTSMSQTMHKKQEDLAVSMRKAIDTGDPMALNDVMEKQNEFSLEAALTNKLVSRGTQTIDQMTKQQ